MEKHKHSIIAVSQKNSTRRRFSDHLKRGLGERTLSADVSKASVALASGIDTILLARWRRAYLIAHVGREPPALIPACCNSYLRIIFGAPNGRRSFSRLLQMFNSRPAD